VATAKGAARGEEEGAACFWINPAHNCRRRRRRRRPQKQFHQFSIRRDGRRCRQGSANGSDGRKPGPTSISHWRSQRQSDCSDTASQPATGGDGTSTAGNSTVDSSL